MSLSAKIRRAPQRAVTGAYILNTGIEKFRSNDDEAAKGIHSLASGAYPALGNVDPKALLKMLGAGEIVLGSALLLPIVPPVVAGAGLATFSGALLGMYWRTPGMHRDNDVRPTQQGTPVAKDVWMFGIGTSLVVDSILARAHDKKVELTGTIKGAKKGAKATRAVAGTTAGAAAALHAATESAHSAGTTAAASAAKSAKAARRRAAARAHTAVASAREMAHSVAERAG